MRSYIHDDRKVTDLFTSVVNRLSSGTTHAKVIHGLLKDVCEHFRFGCGLIYEIDHTGTFLLKEHYSVYHNQDAIRTSLRLEEHLKPEEMERLVANHIFIVQPNVKGSYKSESLTSLFGANSLMITPVIMGPDGTVAGLVAMLDRRHEILMNSESVDAAKVVLKLLANHLKMRIIQQKLTYARNSLDSILDHMGIDIYVNDIDTHEILYLNRSMAEPYGGRRGMMGKKCWEVLYDDKDGECDFCPRENLLDEDGKPTKVYGWDYQRPFDGSWFRVLTAAFPWMDGRMAQVISSVDITENKRNEETIFRLAYFDALTGLPNRRKLVMDLDQTLSRLGESGGHLWLLFFDLDKFKQVNDTLGHQAGDDLLALIGRTLEENPETKGRCYRLGGDEFVVFYEDVERDHVDKTMDWLLKRFSEPWVIEHGSPICRTSIGVAFYPTDGLDAEALLYQADMAMYQAKEGGRGQAVFTTGERYFGAGAGGAADMAVNHSHKELG